MQSDSYLIVGRIRKPQGIRGQVTVEMLTDEPDAIFAAGCRVFAGTASGELARDHAGELVPLVIDSASHFKDGLIVKFDAIPDRTEAERWRQRYLLVPEAQVTPPADDEVYLHELVGMRVQDTAGTPLGEVTATYDLPQGLTLDVQTARGSVLVPYRAEIVQHFNRADRIVTVDANSGLFE